MERTNYLLLFQNQQNNNLEDNLNHQLKKIKKPFFCPFCDTVVDSGEERIQFSPPKQLIIIPTYSCTTNQLEQHLEIFGYKFKLTGVVLKQPNNRYQSAMQKGPTQGWFLIDGQKEQPMSAIPQSDKIVVFVFSQTQTTNSSVQDIPIVSQSSSLVEDSLTSWLQNLRLEHIKPQLIDFGVAHVDDLQYLDNEDIESFTLKPLEKKKLIAEIGKLKGLTSASTSNNNDTPATHPIEPPNEEKKLSWIIGNGPTVHDITIEIGENKFFKVAELSVGMRGDQLKAFVYKHTGIPVGRMFIKGLNHEILDSETLGYYELSTKDTVVAFWSLRGD